MKKNTVSFISTKQLLLFVCLFPMFTLTISQCNTPNISDSKENIRDIQILNPKAGENYFYPYFQAIDVIFKYNPATTKTPVMISFSKDEKKTWNIITPDNYVCTVLNRTEEDPFEYATFKWTPEKDSLKKVKIYLRAVGYDSGPEDYVDIIGPVEID